MRSVSSEEVDQLITKLVGTALEVLLQERCTQTEAAIVRGPCADA